MRAGRQPAGEHPSIGSNSAVIRLAMHGGVRGRTSTRTRLRSSSCQSSARPRDAARSFSSVQTGSTKTSGRSAPMVSMACRSAWLIPPMVKLRPMSTVSRLSLALGGAATKRRANSSAASKRLGGAHQRPGRLGRIQAVVDAPEQRQAEISFQRLHGGAERRDGDAEIVGRMREAAGSASRHEIGQGAKFDHRISRGLVNIAYLHGRRHQSFAFTYALVRRKRRWTPPQWPI